MILLDLESPDPATIPPTDLVGVTVTLITCCYKSKEFIRVGYYVNNEHMDPAINAEIQVNESPTTWLTQRDFYITVSVDAHLAFLYPSRLPVSYLKNSYKVF